MFNSFYLYRDTLINIEMHGNVVVAVVVVRGPSRERKIPSRQVETRRESSGSSHKDPTF